MPNAFNQTLISKCVYFQYSIRDAIASLLLLPLVNAQTFNTLLEMQGTPAYTLGQAVGCFQYSIRDAAAFAIGAIAVFPEYLSILY